ncbi:MAG TPA: hypothetical protein DCP03_06235 [Polaromonas sp.]|uniref:hypothetical protein n=1 Tax=Polaromonas sp. UBA4122 TaxID=1947074 RepID=UPI000EC9C020|nr:hypothetical protein [Polaromonas sp. UBA4122]HAL37722.1 hypothetical protein [Polaromonas sp.]
MPFISFSKAAGPVAPDDVHINTQAVLCVEASGPDLLGKTMIHLLGQGIAVNAVNESLGTVVSGAPSTAWWPVHATT